MRQITRCFGCMFFRTLGLYYNRATSLLLLWTLKMKMIFDLWCYVPLFMWYQTNIISLSSDILNIYDLIIMIFWIFIISSNYWSDPPLPASDPWKRGWSCGTLYIKPLKFKSLSNCVYFRTINPSCEYCLFYLFFSCPQNWCYIYGMSTKLW